MELITPYLHKALLLALNAKPTERSLREQLTARKNEVLRAVCLGYTNKEIAERLNISGNTVRNHIHQGCEKLGATNRTEAVVKANRLARKMKPEQSLLQPE